ncbi:oligopeptide/dipeptide ABC transporter, ATPase subunit [Caldalkalibacillus thermarum TA2.A1]|uniref:Dipeptide ABC transporter ATP-binding protein n=1 Tax=Caldalkalibacillus thermarum (strain TA2.A1) TaxID=986075 RepID=F5L757_CALTT|nr:dipeptide ABC transporter ATP-binding protein [Caldalkalibacillus thermarum]EGL82833.1 oligopeptide/dipeptide ABC transporter, ATPase subunit [Caldalkalibacillus thermarum TA2.A1]QZT34863.1 dipeptide ABC transporter ATP-binding protein [Caldalkalibacillus thermarum TA2.A1]
MSKAPLLQVENLKQYFPIKGGIFGRTINYVKAVDDISFHVNEGETVSIVGESGCGKSTTGRAILRLEEPTAGRVIFQGQDLLKLSKAEMRKKRKDLQIIFQDPFASLNPRQTVRQILEEALAIQNVVPRKQRRQRVIELLEMVGLNADQADRYPHEFSGGQRQRIGIARALSVEPKLVICDEAVSALDVSVQAQVLNLLKKLQREYNLTYLFISHDMGVVRHISDRIIVMYLGKIVEMGDKQSLFENPQHPYTRALLSAIPVADPRRKKERIILKGDVPSPIDPPQGCRFHTRCPFVMDRCKTEAPPMHKLGPQHEAACHLLEEGPVDYSQLLKEIKIS